MKTTVLRYNVIIRKEGRNFTAYVPTLGISDFGLTLEKAKRNIHAAIECHLEGLLKTNTDIPFPDTEEYYISHAEVHVPFATKFAF